ncbi:VCBS repeat-containing protein [candidate division KSB1 bacterium]|nr:VCBS repeat-containing protein [candidate division KSB1 bacterium]
MLIKRVIAIFPIIVLLLSQHIVYSESWQLVPAPTRQNLARLDMVSQTRGWAVSYDGLILSYKNHSWTISDSLQNIPANFLPQSDSLSSAYPDWGDIYAICMVDSVNGWIAVNNVNTRQYALMRYQHQQWALWHTTFPIKFRALAFADSSFGMAVGDGGGFEFRDGGWNVLQLPSSADFRAVNIISQQRMFICGGNGVMLEKQSQWMTVETPLPVLLRDSDFISATEGWLAGNDGILLHYKNGRVIQESTPTTQSLWAIDMLNDHDGFAVGKDGVILRYNGTSWQNVTSPTIADLHDIEMVDDQHGWIVGAWGTILSFNNETEQTRQKQRYFLFLDQVHHESSNLMDRIDDVQGVSAADFNGDQLPDIYLTCYHNLNHLLLNQGAGYFVDYVIESGTGGNVETRIGKSKYEIGSMAADFDRDDDTDLLIAGKPGTIRYLTNNGRAIFTDATTTSGLPIDLDVLDGALADVNEDGYPDIVFADEKIGLRIFLNRKYNRFDELNIGALALPASRIRAIAVFDVNQDGHQDILAFYHAFAPFFLIGDGTGEFQKSTAYFSPQFVTHFVNSISVLDVNTDGYNDVFLCTETGEDALLVFNPAESIFQNRAIEWGVQQEGRSYSAVAGDYDHDGDTDMFVSRFGQDLLYMNVSNQRFAESAVRDIYSKAGHLSGYNTGAATADIDADGDHDLVVGNFDYWSSLLQNTTNDSQFIIVQARGIADTREALGAKVWAYACDSTHRLIAFQEVEPSNGLFSQNWTGVQIGLGNYKVADVKVHFLNGQEFEYSSIPAGTTLLVDQSVKSMQLAYQVSRALMRLLHIPRVPYEILKLALFITLVFISVRFIEKRYHWRASHVVTYVLILVAIYASLTLTFTQSGGWLNHTLPFLMILFALTVLISVNEQLLKSSREHDAIQEQIQTASETLAKLDVFEKTLPVITKTAKLIHAYRFLVIYIYYPTGNFFLCKKSDGINVKKALQQIVIGNQQMQTLMQQSSPVSVATFKSLWPATEWLDEHTLIFPLVKSHSIHGIAMMGLNDLVAYPDSQVISMLSYLFLQLTITLSTIQISKEMRDQEKFAAVGSFAGSIIHNLKNPVDGLRMIVEMLQHDIAPNDPRSEYINELNEGINRLKKMLMSSLDLVSHNDQTKQPVTLSQIFEELNDEFRNHNHGLLRFDAMENNIQINAHPLHLKQAFENLIQNALEASNYAAPVVVRVQLNDNNKTVRVDVIDSGIGISTSQLEKIFTPFYSTHESGRGLGLTITQNIIKNHDGHITVKSNKQHGTRFSVELPVIKSNVKRER